MTGTHVTHPLESIERFEGEKRVVVVAKDGTKMTLPIVLDSPAAHAALADRLNDAMMEVRSGGGYRGAPPRVRVDGSERAEEAEAGDADEPARKGHAR
jgi:hypothetical protein